MLPTFLTSSSIPSPNDRLYSCHSNFEGLIGYFPPKLDTLRLNYRVLAVSPVFRQIFATSHCRSVISTRFRLPLRKYFLRYILSATVYRL